MRFAPALCLIALVSACDDGGDTGACETRFFWFDDDGDGWGINDIDPQEACEPSDLYRVENGLDCDDDDGLITGRTASLCPRDLGPAGDPVTEVTPLRFGTRELVLVHTTGEVFTPDSASDHCGATGWGGQLAIIEDAVDLTRLVDGVPDEALPWAGFIGLDPAREQWGRYSADGTTWVEDQRGVALTELPLCRPIEDTDAGQRFLALVVRQGSTRREYCIGTPDEAIAGLTGTGLPAYEPRRGHFACERPTPDPDDFAQRF